MILKHFMLDKKFLPCIVHLICKYVQGFEIMLYLCKIKWTENQSRKDEDLVKKSENSKVKILFMVSMCSSMY